MAHVADDSCMKRPQKATVFFTLQKATFRLGDRLVFENSSWVFRNNEHWAIVGENGSGKSLLADALRGKLPLVQGELHYAFETPNGPTAEECIGHVGFEDRKTDVHGRVMQSRWNSSEVEQDETVAQHLSFEQVMEVNPFELNPRVPESKRNFELRRRAAIWRLRVGNLLDRKFVSLSNGEMQKVLVVKALCRPIRLLVLDEPFTGLDMTSRKHFQKLLTGLMCRDLRVLFVTAREEELPPGITNVMRVRNCGIVEAGTVAEVMGQTRTGNKNKMEGKRQQQLIRPNSLHRLPQRRGRELVRMRDITVRYGETVILRAVNWTVKRGQSWALLGANGSGKTTLLSLITGDHPQAYGNDVTVFGQRRGSGESIWAMRKRIGFISPELQVHFEDSMTCLQVVESGFMDTVGLFEKPSSSQRKAAREWLRRFDLLGAQGEPLFALSAGLARMVLLARALVKLPELLILDEPCQGLDSSHRDLFNRLVDGLLREGVTTAIYVTHRKEEIPRGIKRVLRLG
jgi:molybdate transport system ATP-binding protein